MGTKYGTVRAKSKAVPISQPIYVISREWIKGPESCRQQAAKDCDANCANHLPHYRCAPSLLMGWRLWLLVKLSPKSQPLPAKGPNCADARSNPYERQR